MAANSERKTQLLAGLADNMDSTHTLDDAILLAAQKHYGKKDKTGYPYVMHVLCIMFRLWSDEERIVGVLHDVVEETDVTLEHLMTAPWKAITVRFRVTE